MTQTIHSAPDPFVFGEWSTVPKGGYRTVYNRTASTPLLNSGENTGVYIMVGQSNLCNQVTTSYTATHASKIDNINIYDGGTYAAIEPLLGCDNTIGAAGTGNVCYQFADKMITNGKHSRVILVPIAISGSPIIEWAPSGSLNNKISAACRRVQALGLSITAFYWEQGAANHGTNSTAYSVYLSSVINTARRLGFDAPWFIAVSTCLEGNIDVNVQAAQLLAPNGVDIFSGANTDLYTGLTYRQADLTHWNTAGANIVSTDMATAVSLHV